MNTNTEHHAVTVYPTREEVIAYFRRKRMRPSLASLMSVPLISGLLHLFLGGTVCVFK